MSRDVGRPATAGTGAHSRVALALAAVAVVGLGIAAYLTWTKLSGVVPPCLPGGGCETVEASPYSLVAGVPVALFGVAYSAAMLVLALVWRGTAERRAGLLAYGLGLIGLLVELYLVYLELVVIRAICTWCVAYGLTVAIGFGLAAWSVNARGRGSGR